MNQKTERKGRIAAVVAAVVALAAVAAITVARLGPGGSIGYTGSPGNPSGSHAFAATPAAERHAADALAFSLPDGAAVSLAQFRGRTILLNMWATWCPPCVAEMPSLDALQAKLGGDGFQVVTVSLDRGGAGTALRWLQQKNLSHLRPYFADPAKFPDAMLPHSMLIDSQGRLAWDGLGGRPWDSPAAEAMIRQVMAETH